MISLGPFDRWNLCAFYMFSNARWKTQIEVCVLIFATQCFHRTYEQTESLQSENGLSKSQGGESMHDKKIHESYSHSTPPKINIEHEHDGLCFLIYGSYNLEI